MTEKMKEPTRKQIKIEDRFSTAYGWLVATLLYTPVKPWDPTARSVTTSEDFRGYFSS